VKIAALVVIILLLVVSSYIPPVYADTCGSGSGGYTVNGAPASAEEYQKCVSDGMAAMPNNTGGSSTTVQAPVHGPVKIIESGNVVYESTPVLTQAPAAPTAKPTSPIYRSYKTYKPAVTQSTSIPSLSPTPRVTPTTTVSHSKPESHPNVSPLAVIGNTIHSLLHFLSFGLLK
jgi:hypothetical protein